MNHDIFISYSRRDTERMQQVRDGLRNAGLSVWTDEGIEPGTESWKRALSDAITGCTSVVVLFSPDAAQSTWVNRELDFAELHNKKIYPLLVRGEVKDALPFGYTTFQFIDIRDDDVLERGLGDLISILSDIYPDRKLATQAHPRISTPDNSSGVVEITRPPAAPQHTETLFKWLETPTFRMSVPSTWKITEPTHENVARMFLLHDSDGVENLFYEFMQNESQMMAEVFPIPGSNLSREKIFSDISGLSIITGAIYRYHGIFPVWDNALTHYLMRRTVRMLAKFMGKFQTTMVDFRQKPAHQTMNNILSFEHETGLVMYLYQTIPYGRKDALITVYLCGTERFEDRIADFDKIALSAQLTG